MVLQYNWPIGLPLVKNMGKGLWELRSTLKTTQARLFFIVRTTHIVVLHGFIKKSNKTPKKELELALRRLKTFDLYEGKENK